MSAHVIGAGCWAHHAGRGTWGGLECVGEGQSMSTGVVMCQEEAVAHRDGAGESQGCLSAVGGLWGASNTLVHVGEGRRMWAGPGTHEWGLGGIAEGWETAWLVAAAGMWVSAVRRVQVRDAAAAAAPDTVGGHCVPQGEVGGGAADDLTARGGMHSGAGGPRQVGDMGDDADGGCQ